MIGYLALPINTAQRLCAKTSADLYEIHFGDLTYEKASLNFLEDYDRENPVFQFKAWEEFLKRLEKESEDTEHSQKMNQAFNNQFGTMIQQSQGTHIMGGLNNYAHNKLALDQVYQHQFSAPGPDTPNMRKEVTVTA